MTNVITYHIAEGAVGRCFAQLVRCKRGAPEATMPCTSAFELLELARQYGRECAECNGTGKTTDLETVSPEDFARGERGPVIDCPDCADIRAIIARATT